MNILWKAGGDVGIGAWELRAGCYHGIINILWKASWDMGIGAWELGAGCCLEIINTYYGKPV